MGCPGKVYAVDHWLGSPTERDSSHSEVKTKDIFKEFMENVGYYSNLVVLKMDSLEAAKQFEDGGVDMVFIDGDHTEGGFGADLDAWVPKAKRLICGHDIGMTGIRRTLELHGLADFKRLDPGQIWYKEILR